MAHKTMIDGVAYEIGGGKTLIDGTAFAIDKGKTLVGGTAYEVGFAPAEHDVVIAGGTTGIVVVQRTVEIDGNVYSLLTGSVNIVTKNTSKMIVNTIQGLGSPIITLNGETIFTGIGECTVDLSDVTHVQLIAASMTLTITTYNITAPEDVTVTVTGTGYTSAAFIEHNGITYTSATTFTAKTGDLIYVKWTSSQLTAMYYYVVTSNIEVKLAVSSYTSGIVTITPS